MSARRARRDAERVRHILEAAAKLAEIVADGRAAFDADWRQRLSAERLLIIVGEAGRHLSDEFAAARPALQLHRARGMRNFLVHEYDDVDPQRLWDAITTSVPEFVAALGTEINPEAPRSIGRELVGTMPSGSAARRRASLAPTYAPARAGCARRPRST